MNLKIAPSAPHDSRARSPRFAVQRLDAYAALMAAIAELCPTLRSRVAETEALRSIPPSTVADLKRLGLARLLQPMRFGGYEAPLSSMVDVLVPVAAACGSTAWSLAQYVMHDYMVARWVPEAQERVWGVTPDALVSGILIPRLGRARAVDGGYRVSGRWPLVSGVVPSDWCIISAFTEETSRDPIDLHVLVPTRSLTIHPTWTAIGLKGSGSDDIEIHDLFIPEAMTIGGDDLKGGDNPGSASTPGALYRAPVYMCFGIVLTSAVVGMATSMLDEFLSQCRHRQGLMSGKGLGDFPTQQVKIAEASAALDAAETLLRGDCAKITALAEADQNPDAEFRARIRSNAAFAGHLASRAATLVWDMAGSRSVYEGEPIGRIYADMMVAIRHVTQNWDINMIEHGRARLGLPLTNPAL